MKPPDSREALIEDALFPRLKSYIIQRTGLNYYQDKDNDLAERVRKRLHTLRLDDCREYLQCLEGLDGVREMDLLIEKLTIGETYFFRHSEQFAGLRDIVIPDILGRNRDARRLRIWSAGCSTGAEAYSISVLLGTHFKEQLKDWDVGILGTDINREFLHQARNGSYDEWAFRGTSAELRQNCFTRVGTKWRIRDEYQRHVTFQYHNLITDAFPPMGSLGAFDLILCRNVVIYFTQEDFRQIVLRFEACLDEGGWLLVGHAEPNLEFFQAFCLVSMPGAILYQRTGGRPSDAVRAHPENVVPAWMPPNLDAFPIRIDERRDLVVPPARFNEELHVPAGTPAVQQMPAGTPAVQDEPAVRKEDVNAVRRLADQGHWDDAAAMCERLLFADNLSSDVHLLHALILEHLERDAESEQALRRAVYLDRNSALAHYYLGLRQRKNREFSPAARSFESVLRLLDGAKDRPIFAVVDGVSAGQLRQLAQIQLEALGPCEKRSTGSK